MTLPKTRNRTQLLSYGNVLWQDADAFGYSPLSIKAAVIVFADGNGQCNDTITGLGYGT